LKGSLLLAGARARTVGHVSQCSAATALATNAMNTNHLARLGTQRPSTVRTLLLNRTSPGWLSCVGFRRMSTTVVTLAAISCGTRCSWMNALAASSCAGRYRLLSRSSRTPTYAYRNPRFGCCQGAAQRDSAAAAPASSQASRTRGNTAAQAPLTDHAVLQAATRAKSCAVCDTQPELPEAWLSHCCNNQMPSSALACAPGAAHGSTAAAGQSRQ